MQQAVFVQEVGKPLVLGTRAIPEPQQGQIQIKVDATMLLPHDTYGWDFGLFIGTRLPFVLGTNIAGTVVKTSPEITAFATGDHVFGLGNPLFETPDMSGLQQYALLTAESAAKIPEGFTADQMVTFPVNAVTSFSAIFNEKGFGFPAPFPGASITDFDGASQTILVVGGGSNVGKLALQYAKLAGIGRVITIASASGTEELKKLGATHVIDRHSSAEEIAARLKQITGEEGVTHIYDCVSWDYTFSVSLLSKTKPSTLLTLHPAEDAQKLVEEKGVNARVTFILGTSDFMQPLAKQFWKSLPGWVEGGKLLVGKYKVIEGLELKSIQEGLDLYRDGSAVTPVVVHPNS